MEKDGEPGSARFGNFINYYSFNPPGRRLEFIPKNLLCDLFPKCCGTEQPMRVAALDIGCNAGDLTCALYSHLTEETKKDNITSQENTPVCDLDLGHHVSSSPDKVKADGTTQVRLSMLGVDIDETLITRSRTLVRDSEHDIKFEHLNIMDHDQRKVILDQYLRSRDKDTFDVIFCFSTTMWIHLHHGDKGLEDFLRYLATSAKYVVLEAQPWKCYRSAVKRMKKLDCQDFAQYKMLKLRQNVDKEIERLMSDAGMNLIRRFGETSWERQICLFKSTNGSQ